MRRTAIAFLLVTPLASAQVLVAPAQLARVRRNFEARPGDTSLRCEVTPLAPALNFAFRFQAGYSFHVPQSQYSGPTRGWSVLTAVTPEDGAGVATYLLARDQFLDASRVGGDFDIRGLYFLGVGRYAVESILRDDRNRICRKQWRIVVQTARADRAVPLALPPDTVRQFSALDWPDIHHPDDASPMRLTVLLNAAAFSPRRSVLRPSDRMVLTGAVNSLLEHLPATSVRVVAFSLEQQREVFRRDDFAPPDVSKLADAIVALPLATVDVRVLQKPLGHVDFLAGLIARELAAPHPADTVVFWGPTSRYGSAIPKGALPTPAGAQTRFYYLRYEGPRRPPAPSPIEIQVDNPTSSGTPGGTAPGDGSASSSGTTQPAPPRPPPSQGSGGTGGSGGASMGGGGGGGAGGRGRGERGGLPPFPSPGEGQPDIITAAVARLKGKTLVIHTPAELAKAIRKIEDKR